MDEETDYNVDEKVQTLAETQYRNLQGKTYSITEEDTLADSEIFYIHFTTGDKPIITSIDPNSSGKFLYSLYEDQGDMDVNNDGGTIKPLAFNRVVQKSHSTNWQKNPTVNNTGSELIELTSSGAAGATNGPLKSDSTPGAVSRELKWVFNKNTDYLIKIEDATSDSNTDTANIVIDFTETDLNL